MKRSAALALTLMMVLVVSGCSRVTFSTPSKYESLNGSSQVAVSLEEQSLSKTGLTLLIQSSTSDELSYDMSYAIEQKKADGWYAMDGNWAFNSLAAILQPGDTNEFNVTWEKPLPKGSYRVVKSVYTREGEAFFAVEFDVL